jgi:hypothetical protein
MPKSIGFSADEMTIYALPSSLAVQLQLDPQPLPLLASAVTACFSWRRSGPFPVIPRLELTAKHRKAPSTESGSAPRGQQRRRLI